MMVGKNTSVDTILDWIPQESVGVELGVWKGDSSEKFLRFASHLHLVDPWSVQPYMTDENEWGSPKVYLDRYAKVAGEPSEAAFQRCYEAIFHAVVKRFEGKPVTIWRMTTDEFFEVFKGKVDWVYVDGCHTKEGCLNDLWHSLAILSPKGLIMGDDYGNKAGVTEAIQEFTKETCLTLNVNGSNQYVIET